MQLDKSKAAAAAKKRSVILQKVLRYVNRSWVGATCDSEMIERVSTASGLTVPLI